MRIFSTTQTDTGKFLGINSQPSDFVNILSSAFIPNNQMKGYNTKM